MSETGNQISAQNWQLWLQNPSSIQLKDMEALQNLHRQYPWMAKTYKLLACLSKKENLSSFSYWNQYAALTSSNNHELFDLIQGIETTSTLSAMEDIPWIDEIESEKKSNDPFTQTSTEAIVPPSLAELVLGEEKHPLKTLSPEEDWAPIPLIELEVTIAEEKKIEELEPSVPLQIEEDDDDAHTIDLGELGHDIMSKAISSSIEMEVSEPIVPEQKEKTIATSSHFNPDQKVDWEDDFLNFIADSIGERVEKPKDVTTEPKEDLDVIDRFIQKEPQITRGRLLDFEVGNMAKDSLEEDYNLVTETMAKLYIKQGKIEKARKAYKKLIELFPEKSIYFATQLKNLNKKNQ